MDGVDNFDVGQSFFIIDSNNLEEIETKLYGYCILNGEMLENESLLNGQEPTGEGAYVYIKKDFEKITVKQDFIGSYGLYLFRDEDYFALSNSFIMLEDYIKQTHKITLNKEYADHFIVSGLCSVAYSQTMVNEISLLDRAAIVEIEVESKKLNLIHHDYQENTVDLDSEEGIKILDEWYYKWRNVIKRLKSKTNHIQTDLSGGFDSRMTFGLFLGADIDLNDIFIHTIEDDLHTHKEDYEIASAIGEYYGFNLNNKTVLVEEANNYTKEDILNISFYTKLGFHKQMYFKYGKLKKYRYCFTGSGGECVRNYWNTSEKKYIDNQVASGRKYTTENVDLTTSVGNIIDSSFQEIRKKYEKFGRNIEPEDMTLNLYRETRCRNHFGKNLVENYFAGVINFCPLLDPDLHRLKLNSASCEDKNLLMAVMFDRYNSKLLDFKFEGGRSIDATTIECARNINKKFQFRNLATEEICKSGVYDIENNSVSLARNERNSPERMNELVKNIFYSKKVRKSFEIIYDEKTYCKLAEKIESEKFFPLQNAFVVMAISKIQQDVVAYENMYCFTISEYLKNELKYKVPQLSVKTSLRNHSYLDNYITARIDIKNKSKEENDIDIVEISDNTASVKTPKWFRKNGKGYVIESNKGDLNVVFKCINSGKLEITLRGRDVRDADNDRIPFWIDYETMWINNEKVFDTTHYVWHDAPFKITRTVEDGEIINLVIKWSPHDEKKYRVNSFIELKNEVSEKVKKEKVETSKKDNVVKKGKNILMGKIRRLFK